MCVQVKDEAEVQGANAYVLFYERIGEGEEATTTPTTTPTSTPRGKDKPMDKPADVVVDFSEGGGSLSATSAPILSPSAPRDRKGKKGASPWLVRKQSLSPGARGFWPHLTRQRSAGEDQEDAEEAAGADSAGQGGAS
jgi:hypothetical protein